MVPTLADVASAFRGYSIPSALLTSDAPALGRYGLTAGTFGELLAKAQDGL